MFFSKGKVYPAEVFPRNKERPGVLYNNMYIGQSELISSVTGKSRLLSPLKDLEFVFPLFAMISNNNNMEYIALCAWVARELTKNSSILPPEILEALLEQPQNHSQKQQLEQPIDSFPDREITFRLKDIKATFVSQNKRMGEELAESIALIENNQVIQVKYEEKSLMGLFPLNILNGLLYRQNRPGFLLNLSPDEVLTFKVKDIKDLFELYDKKMNKELAQLISSVELRDEIRLKEEDLKNSYKLLQEIKNIRGDSLLVKLIVETEPSAKRKLDEDFNLDSTLINLFKNLSFPWNIKCLSELLIEGTCLNYTSGMNKYMRKSEETIVQYAFDTLKSCCIEAFQENKLNDLSSEIAAIVGQPDLIPYIPNILHLLCQNYIPSTRVWKDWVKKEEIKVAVKDFVDALDDETKAYYQKKMTHASLKAFFETDFSVKKTSWMKQVEQLFSRKAPIEETINITCHSLRRQI